MKINNSFNVFPFYDTLQKQNSKKWYSFGQHYPLICPNNKLLPFQFVTNEEIIITGNIVAVNVITGQTTDLGVKPVVMLGTQPGAQYYIVKLSETAIGKSLEGLHYLQINTNKGYIYSEEFVFTDSYSECVRLEYWNEDTLNFSSGEINFDDDFKFVMYISSTIGKPEYEFEEELTKRLGYKFIESQTSNKIYKFNFLAPEYICDAMRLVRMCDYIKLTTKYDTYNALSFAYEPRWQDNGDLAAVDVEFDTDCIIQKLESFNRRVKESFYNALLSEIDEPVLFSTDTVAQYYTEFTTTSYINGKLIRQLEALNEDELQNALDSLVLPIDNQSDSSQTAKKVFLADIIRRLMPQVDLSSYLLKSVWDTVFELKTDKGTPYLYGKLPLVLKYGVTMYTDDGSVDLPSIYAGLPIDNETIIRDANGVLMINPNINLGGGLDYVELESYLTDNNYAKKSDIPSLSGYATESWVLGKGYASSSDLSALTTKVNDFLEGSDTDNIINKWKELETFLSGLSQSDNLATILGNKAEKTDLDKYIPIAGATDITGEKNFIGGLKINGSPIYYDTEKKYWKLEGDLLITGGVTMYGNDSDFVPSTIMDAILYDDSTLGINANGELYVKGGTGGGTVSGDYLPLSGGTISGTSAYPLVVNTTDVQSGIQFLSNNDLLGVIINGGDYGTALINFKGKYRALGIDNDGNAYTTIDNSNTKANLLHTHNYSSYALPLSGGTISNSVASQLKIINSAYTDAYIEFGSSSAIYGHAGVVNFSDVGVSASFGHAERIIFPSIGGMYYRTSYNGTNHTIWHSGNDGSGSGLDADLLDGYDNGSFFINRNIALNADNINTTLIPGCYHTANYSPINGAYKYGTVLNFRGGVRQTQFYIPDGAQPYANGGRLFFRDMWNAAESITTAWYEIITSASVGSFNAGSATKLQTARTIWGQSFDGTGNVDGRIRVLQDVASNFTEDIVCSFLVYSQSPYGLITRAYNNGNVSLQAQRESNKSETFPLLLNPNGGNVGMGTNNPRWGLDVAGSIGVGYNLYFNSGVIGRFSNIGYDNTTSIVAWKGIDGTQLGYVGYYQDHFTMANVHGGNAELGFVTIYTNGTVDVSYNMLVRGGITMYSDERKKTILNHVQLSLKQIAEAPLIEHYYNSDQNKTTHVGSIAQYWAEMNDWFCKKDSEGYYTMEIQNAALASAISVARELVKFESKTDRRIRILEEENKRLKEEVEYLKLNIA